MSTSMHPDPLVAFRTEIADLPVAELRRRFPGEFNTHRRILADAKAGRCTAHAAFRAFRDFLGHVGPQGERSRTLDRIANNDPEYGPGKVRWATPREQANNRSTTRKVRGPDGTIRPVTEWARQTGQKADTIRNRLDLGWPEENAVSGQRGSSAAARERDTGNLNGARDRPALGWPKEMEKPKYEAAYKVFIGPHPPGDFTRSAFAVWILHLMIRRNEAGVLASFPDYDPIEEDHDHDPPPALARLPAYQGLQQARRLIVPLAASLTPAELRAVEALKLRDSALTHPIFIALGWVPPDR